MNPVIETQIGYATKIGKQALLSQYKEQVAQLSVKALLENEVIAGCYENFSTLIDDVSTKALEMYAETPVYIAAKALENAVEAENRGEECNGITHDAMDTVRNLDPRDHIYYHHRTGVAQIEEALQEKFLTIKIEHEFNSRLNSQLNYALQEFVEVPLEEDTLDMLQKMLVAYNTKLEYTREISTLGNKIEGIDAHMERIEAELLVKELQSSDKGKEVLALTQAIMGQTTGLSIPALEVTPDA